VEDHLVRDQWSELTTPLVLSSAAFPAVELGLSVDPGSELWVDDVILYEPGDKK
jgi:hypothetical protein